MKKIIILGASDGLGKAIANLCITKNIEVVNISRTPCNIEQVTNISCDLSKQEDIDKAIQEIKKEHTNFSAIINCAAIVALEKINEITYSKFEKAFKVNTIAPLYFLSALYDNIVSNEADILNVGTTAAIKLGFPDQLAYTSTKYGLRGGSYNFGLELAKTRSRVIHIHLGGMNTKMHEKDYGAKIEDPNSWMDPVALIASINFVL